MSFSASSKEQVKSGDSLGAPTIIPSGPLGRDLSTKNPYIYIYIYVYYMIIMVL